MNSPAAQARTCAQVAKLFPRQQEMRVWRLQLGATRQRYLSAMGARAMDMPALLEGIRAFSELDAAIAGVGLKLKCQSFTHPVYPKAGSSHFIPGLSIFDALVNCGLDHTRRVLVP